MSLRLKPLLLALAPLALAHAAEPPLDTARIDSVFAAFKTDAPGCALGVYRDGEIRYAKGYGLADLNHGVPIRPDTVFDIGSTSKQFTAVALLLLAQDGKLSLDDSVQQHLPELAKSLSERFTIRQMLQHTAGLPDYTELMMLAGHAFENATGEAEALQSLLGASGLNFKPGSYHLYSNSGYFLAALVAEKVSGQKLDALLQERLFKPLGMKDTHVRTDHSQVVARRATAYGPGENGFAIEMSNWDQAGDGAIQSSVNDLARWDGELANPKVLKPELIAALRTPGHLSDGTPLNYGMGTLIDRYRGLQRFHHSGAWGGYRAITVQYPQQHLGLALTCNVGTANTDALAQRVADVLLAEQFTEAAPVPSAPQAFDAKAFVGRYYDAQTRAVLLIQPDARVPGGTEMRLGAGGASLRSIGARELQSASGITRLSWSADGLTVDLQRRSDNMRQRFKRLPDFKAEPAQLQALAGRYEAQGLGSRWDLLLKDGKLLAKPPGQDAGPIEWVGADLLQGPGFVLQLQRDAKGQVQGFEYSSDRVKGLRFGKA